MRSDSSAIACPPWLEPRLLQSGGSVPFDTFMGWALHDPQHGAYGSGALRIGPAGDFATAPSLGPDFAALLAPQLADWLEGLQTGASDADPLALIEAGPGEGSLALQLAEALWQGWPDLAARCELVLVEPNPGMRQRQQQRLQASPLPVRWSDFPSLAARPPRGVLVAHEVLDALAVERIVQHTGAWHRQRVALHGDGLELVVGEPLDPGLMPDLQALGLVTPEGRANRPEGWCSELHPQLEPWLRDAAGAVREGWLLVIDYAMEAWRYYAPQRANGTLMAYRDQRAGGHPLADAGRCDLTAHLCLDSLERAAQASGWRWAGSCRQGEALLALGLAARLHGLQQRPETELAELLRGREALLRLVDPTALGDFRWVALQRQADQATSPAGPTPRFLQPPEPASPSLTTGA